MNEFFLGARACPFHQGSPLALILSCSCVAADPRKKAGADNAVTLAKLHSCVVRPLCDNGVMGNDLKKKAPVVYAESLMSVDSRGRLVLDAQALRDSGVLNRQFRAAERLHEVLKVKRVLESKVK